MSNTLATGPVVLAGEAPWAAACRRLGRIVASYLAEGRRTSKQIRIGNFPTGMCVPAGEVFASEAFQARFTNRVWVYYHRFWIR